MAKSHCSSSMNNALATQFLFLLLAGMASAQLSPNFYANSCPGAISTIRSAVVSAVALEPRMGASLLRLHFHDCFVQGCDASVLLDDTANFKGEKTAFPNNNSLRGFDVIDNIKAQLEKICPGVVSCADILTVAARDAVVALGGPGWGILLGRKDSITASLTAANTEIASPFLNLDGLIASFANKGFTAKEMVALSGAHTFGKARCVTFRTRLYNESNINPVYAATLKLNCPSTGGDDNLSNFDVTTPLVFDNAYYINLLSLSGLLHSDQQLYNGSGGATDSQVSNYAFNIPSFFSDFSNAMIKMDNLSPLTGTAGQIRTNCRKVN